MQQSAEIVNLKWKYSDIFLEIEIKTNESRSFFNSFSKHGKELLKLKLLRIWDYSKSRKVKV